MKHRRTVMGIPVTVWLLDKRSDADKRHTIETVFKWFTYVDETYSPYKPSSVISQLNSGLLKRSQLDPTVADVLSACEHLPARTMGYFSIEHQGKIDPSGYVKGWALQQAAEQIRAAGFSDFMIDGAGDVIVHGDGPSGDGWQVGIRVPGEQTIAKRLRLRNAAIATSGTYERGNHIYNPHTGLPATDLASVTIVGPDMTTADIMATTFFAMGNDYQQYLGPVLPLGYELYVINKQNSTLFTPGLQKLFM